MVRSIGVLSTVGLSFVLAVVIGVMAGLWLDARLGTRPYLFFAGLILGFAAGVVNVVRASRTIK